MHHRPSASRRANSALGARASDTMIRLGGIRLSVSELWLFPSGSDKYLLNVGGRK